MLLYVPHVVEQQLGHTHLGPIGSNALRRELVGQRLNPSTAFGPAIIEIGAFSSISMAAPNCRQMVVFQAGPISTL
jgi:hypothetical protein